MIKMAHPRPDPLSCGSSPGPLSPSDPAFNHSPGVATNTAAPYVNMYPGFLSDGSESFSPSNYQLSPNMADSPLPLSPTPSAQPASTPGQASKPTTPSLPRSIFPPSSPAGPSTRSGSQPMSSLSSPASTTGSGSGSGKFKRRPKPLNLSNAGSAIGQDEELASQREADGMSTALSSAFTIVSASSDGELSTCSSVSRLEQ
jgi:hypothetical protein